MKKLEKKQMEDTHGGAYCSLLLHWLMHDGGGGYQGDFDTLITTFYRHCG
jgi:hypothetical protein